MNTYGNNSAFDIVNNYTSIKEMLSNNEIKNNFDELINVLIGYYD